MKEIFKLLIPLIFLFSCAYELSIPEGTLESYISKEFPKEKDLFLSKVIVKNPNLKLLGNNKGELSFDLEIVPPFGKKLGAKVDTVGTFQFNPKTKTLYLVNLQPKKILFNGKKVETGLVTKTVNLLIGDVLKGIPVYKIEGEKARLVKGIEIKKGKLIVKVGV